MDTVIEPLRPYHDRKSFNCGEPGLNDYLRLYAQQNSKKDFARIFVAVAAPESPRILGYYTLSSFSVEQAALPLKGQPPYARPTALIGRLARDLSVKGQGVGSILLRDALYRCLSVSDQIALFAVVVDALNKQAEAFYTSFGFIPIGESNSLTGYPRKLYLPMKTIRKACTGS